MPGGGIRKTPYITKNPAYDSFKCECGALLRLKSPSSIEEHRNRVSHKKLMELISKSSAPCDTPLETEDADPRPSLDLPATSFVLLPSPLSSNHASSHFQLFG